jgi:PAS domain S-box-containing protein
MTARQQSIDTLRVISLVALTGALVFLGVVSVVNRLYFEVATDGAVWTVQDDAMFAEVVEPDGPADRAGIEPGDRLVAIAGNAARADRPDFVDSVLWTLIPGYQIDYVVERNGETIEASLIVDLLELDTRAYIYLCLVGAASLIAGVFVLMRRREADTGAQGQMSGVAARFFWLALAFYALTVLYPTRPENPFNGPILWIDQLARNALPGLFLYFALTFPRPKPHFEQNRRVWLIGVFAPGIALFLAWTPLLVIADPDKGALFRGAEGLGLTPAMYYSVVQLLTNIDLVYFAASLGLGLLLVAHSYRVADSPVERRRLTWLIGGTAIAFFPFVAIYVPLYVVLGVSHPLMDLTVLPFAAIPICFGYAAVGFRLWDVEVILKTALAYSATVLAVLGLYVGAERLIRSFLDPEIAVAGAFLATLLVAIMFAPLRDRIQDGLDRLYYRERYRSRRGILDFARDLNAELDLGQVVALLVQRVRKMVAVGRIAVMLEEEEGTRLRLVSDDGSMAGGPQLSSKFSKFLAAALTNRDFIYIEDLTTLLEEFPEDRDLLAEEDLAYFLPLVVKGEVLGLLALGRTLSGDYLSSEDLKVLQMLTSHAALALDNALMYRQAHARAHEFEQLKNYNENIVQSIKVGVMVLDTDGRVRSWNHSMEETHGIRANEAIRQQVDELFPTSFSSALQQARQRVEEGAETIASAYRVALRGRDDVDRIVNISVAPLLGERGRQPTVVIVDDVSEATELESQLRQSDRLASVGLLAAGVAHEVNTPLAGISSYVQMMQRKMPDSDPRRPILEKIEKQTFRASSIVNNLLNFSRQQASDMHAVDLNTVVEETLTLAELPLSKRKVRVGTELSESLAPVWGDPGKLQQVLMNLVLNARDSMPDGGDLNIRTVQQNGEVVVEVADTGAGIPEEQIHKIYDPFFTTKGTGKGTGLGLSVTYGIVQEHRGTITVRSEAASGTVFRVALPAAAAGRTRAAS